MMKKILFSLAFILSALFASAHAIWIETALTGTKGKTQEVRVYLGEYAENVRDSVTKWFSNMKDVQLYAIAPNGERQQITLKANGNHLLGSFTPSADGTYTLAISHTVADIYGETRIEYYATATVNAGKAGTSSLSAAANLSVVPAAETAKKGQELSLQVFSNKQPVEGAKVEAISPAGWIKTVHSDAKGAAAFAPLEAGLYQLEVSRSEKTPGEHNGKPYKTISYIVTHCVTVK